MNLYIAIMRYISLFLITLTSFTFACMRTPTDYFYSDGNSNQYILRGSTLSFNPVRPKESSSGTYSGGQPKTVTISSKQASDLKSLLEQAISNVEAHQPNRVKGTAAIIITRGGEERRCVLKRDSREIALVDAMIAECMK